MTRFFLLLISIFLFACSSDEPAKTAVAPKETSQAASSLDIQKAALENKELKSAKDFLESQKKAADELAEKLKGEAALLQQKFEDTKTKLQAQLDLNKTFEAEKEKFASTIKEKEELITNAKKSVSDLEAKVSAFKPTDTSALTKELKEKNDTIKSLTDERNSLKEEVKSISDKLKAITDKPNDSNLLKKPGDLFKKD
jgi:chromosome segregation ATPase